MLSSAEAGDCPIRAPTAARQPPSGICMAGDSGIDDLQDRKGPMRLPQRLVAL